MEYFKQFIRNNAHLIMEFSKDEQIFGIGCKIFTIAGPVIL